MNFELAKKYSTDPSKSDSTLIVFASSVKGKDKKTASAKIYHSEAEKLLKRSIEDKLISGKPSEVVAFREVNFENFRHLLVVGIEPSPSHENYRSCAAQLHAAVKSLKSQNVVIDVSALPGNKKQGIEFLKALVEGMVLSSYEFDELKTNGEKNAENKNNKKTKEALNVLIATKLHADKEAKAAIAQAQIVSECVNFSRRLGDLPGNLLTPTILADTAAKAAKETGVKATIWDKARIKKERMGGLIGVSNGSEQEPRFIILEYHGAAKSEKPIVLVGKGLTFDSGGISIKPSAAMEEMKYDMCGAANVIGATLAAAKLKLKVNLVCLVASTENMPGSAATKPGDVHTARNGKTFEVNNTDAEGRLILADALSYASELNPEFIIDAATLTGAMLVALGNIHTGYFTRNNALKKEIESAATRSGELVWNMPLTDFHVKDMKGTFADLSNISSGKGAGSATAAAFLEQFVGEGIPWAHFDIAGTGWATGNRFSYCPKKGASGVMIRTFLELIKEH
jgi:leucyl aminopeptidase